MGLPEPGRSIVVTAPGKIVGTTTGKAVGLAGYFRLIKVKRMSREKEVFDDIEGLVLEEARKTYSPKVIDHFLHPRNVGALEHPDSFNAMSGICGDTVGIYVGVDHGEITRISFVTNGCGPTIACSSAITCMAKGLRIQEAMRITGKDLINYLGGLPVEHTHCADLAVNTLRSALAKAG